MYETPKRIDLQREMNISLIMMENSNTPVSKYNWLDRQRVNEKVPYRRFEQQNKQAWSNEYLFKT